MNEIVVATLEHARALAPALRAGDKAEIAAASGWDPEAALVLSVAASPRSYTWLRDGVPLAIFGVSPDPFAPTVGIPWMLATDAAAEHPTYILRRSREWLPKLAEGFDVLTNKVDCRNVLAIQWLSWLGFVFTGLDPQYGVQRLPFLTFALTLRAPPFVIQSP